MDHFNFHTCDQSSFTERKSIIAQSAIYLYIYNSSVRVYVTELLLNGWTDFDEIFWVCSKEFENGLDS